MLREMVHLRVAHSVTQSAEVSEEEIQKAFQEDLTVLEEGMRFGAEFVPVGRGEIDTLAIDDEDRLVVIEYKKPGGSDYEALVQAMDYAVWCEEHLAHIEKYIRKSNPKSIGGIDHFPEDVRIILVASDFDERIKNAAYAVENQVALYSYSLMPHENNRDEIRIVPNLVVDTGIPTSRPTHIPKTQEDHLRGHENLKQLYDKLTEKVLEIDRSIKVNPAPQDYIGLSAKKLFGAVHFKKKWIRLDLWYKTTHPRYTTSSGEWGYTHIEKESDIDDTVVQWIKSAYHKAS
jgi:predicted transport protein